MGLLYYFRKKKALQDAEIELINAKKESKVKFWEARRMENELSIKRLEIKQDPSKAPSMNLKSLLKEVGADGDASPMMKVGLWLLDTYGDQIIPQILSNSGGLNLNSTPVVSSDPSGYIQKAGTSPTSGVDIKDIIDKASLEHLELLTDLSDKNIVKQAKKRLGIELSTEQAQEIKDLAGERLKKEKVEVKA